MAFVISLTRAASKLKVGQILSVLPSRLPGLEVAFHGVTEEIDLLLATFLLEEIQEVLVALLLLLQLRPVDLDAGFPPRLGSSNWEPVLAPRTEGRPACNRLPRTPPPACSR